MLVLNLRAFENKKYAAYDRFHGNSPAGEISTKKEPIRTLGFAVPYNNPYYYTTQAVRGPISKINQSKCSIAGPILLFSSCDVENAMVNTIHVTYITHGARWEGWI